MWQHYVSIYRLYCYYLALLELDNPELYTRLNRIPHVRLQYVYACHAMRFSDSNIYTIERSAMDVKLHTTCLKR